MKDFFKQDLVVGDTVAFITRHYRDFTKGKVVGFTSKQVRVAYPSAYDGTDTTLRYSNALIKQV